MIRSLSSEFHPMIETLVWHVTPFSGVATETSVNSPTIETQFTINLSHTCSSGYTPFVKSIYEEAQRGYFITKMNKHISVYTLKFCIAKSYHILNETHRAFSKYVTCLLLVIALSLELLSTAQKCQLKVHFDLLKKSC